MSILYPVDREDVFHVATLVHQHSEAHALLLFLKWAVLWKV